MSGYTPSIFLLFRTVTAPCFLPGKESLHLLHRYTGKILICSCLEIWYWMYLLNCLVFAQKEEILQLPCICKNIFGTFMAYSGKHKRKNGFHQVTGLYGCHYHLTFFSLFLISKTISPDALLGQFCFLYLLSFLCFFPCSSCLLFVGMSSLLAVFFFSSLFSELISWFLVPCMTLTIFIRY